MARGFQLTGDLTRSTTAQEILRDAVIGHRLAAAFDLTSFIV